MGDKIDVNYEELANIVKLFSSEMESINQLFNLTRQKVDQLHGANWIGRGSDQFFAEMQQTVLPSMARLVRALGEGASTTQRIAQTYQAAEEEAKSIFTAS